jgi:hypothetical protein
MITRFAKALLFLTLPVLAFNAFADELSLDSVTVEKQKAILIGHNVTPTTDIPLKKSWTVGTYALGVSVTENLFLATSPWIWVSYNTANFHLKYSRAITPSFRVALFGSYFESFNSTPFITEAGGNPIGDVPTGTPLPGGRGRRRVLSPQSDIHAQAVVSTYTEQTNRYQWKSASLHMLASYELGERVTVYGNIHYGYFWNDDFPYSIRMDPGHDSIRGQVDMTTLTQVKLGATDFHVLGELGALGVNYLQPYLQIGASLAYLSESWLVQLGASATMPFSEAFTTTGWMPGRYDGRQHESQSENRTYYYRYLQTALHPEVQLQYYF